MNRETPAGYSRTLYTFVKTMHRELAASGYPPNMIMVMLADVMVQLADDQAHDTTMMAMLEQVKARRLL